MVCACEFVEESRQLLPRSSAWIGIGDFNDEPCDAWLRKSHEEDGCILKAVLNDSGVPLPIRWGGQRAIDYCLASTDDVYHHPWFHEEAIADHRIVCSYLSLQCPDKQPVHRWLKHGFKGRPKGFDKEKWDEFFMEKWQKLQKPGCPQVATQAELDAAWQHLETCYQVALNFACRRAADEMNQGR